MRFRLVPKSVTLNDFERRMHCPLSASGASCFSNKGLSTNGLTKAFFQYRQACIHVFCEKSFLQPC